MHTAAPEHMLAYSTNEINAGVVQSVSQKSPAGIP